METNSFEWIEVAKLVVPGEPQPRGSKTAMVPRDPRTKQPYKRENGTIIVQMVDSNRKSKPYMERVRATAVAAWQGRAPLACPIGVSLELFFERPKSHFGTGKNSKLLKPSAPDMHTTKPDIDKVCRCILDGMTGVIFEDDKQICEILPPFTKRYALLLPGAIVRVFAPLAFGVVDDDDEF